VGFQLLSVIIRNLQTDVISHIPKAQNGLFSQFFSKLLSLLVLAAENYYGCIHSICWQNNELLTKLRLCMIMITFTLYV